MIKVEGIIVPVLTALTPDQELDETALRDHCQWLKSQGVNGFFPNGSTGEFFALSEKEQARVLKIVIEESGEVPVYAGCPGIGTRDVIASVKRAEEAGANVAVVLTPFYITPNQHELYEHYKTIAAATFLPIVVYLNPNRTGGVSCTPETIARLSKIKNIVAVKDSCAKAELTAEYIALTDDNFSVMQGCDDLISSSLQAGVNGAISAVANVLPAEVVELYKSKGSGELAAELQKKITTVRHSLVLGTFPAALKAAMEIIERPMGPSRSPVAPLTSEAHSDLQQRMRSAGILTSKIQEEVNA